MAAEVVVKFIGDSKSFDRAAGRVSAGLGGLGRAALATGAMVATAAVGVGAFSLKAFGDFDQAMTESLAIMGDVSDAMRNDMSDAAREVGKTTTFSATQAAESFYFLASAGLSAEASIAALPAVAAFGQAGMFDMATATDLLTDAQSALGLTVDDAAENLDNMTRVSDVLVTANTLANASVQQFSEALTNKAGPAMRALGMDVEEGVAVLAAFADQGVKGDEAGTQFGIVLRDLQTKALQNADAFAAAGVSVFDASGEFNNMGDIIGDLETSLDGMSDAQRKATLLNLGFSDKSVSALTTLLGTSEAIQGYEEALRDAGGTTSTVADKQLESFNAQMGLIKSRVTDAAIVIGSKLAPIVLETFKKMDEFWAIHGKSIMEGFTRIGEVISGVINKIREMWATDGPGILSKITAFATGAWAVIQKYWPQIKETISTVMNSIRSIITSVVEIATAFWDRFGSTIMEVVKIAFEFVLKFIANAFKIFQGIFMFFAGLFEGDWQKMWDGIKLVLEGAWGILVATLEGLLKGIWAVLKGMWPIAKSIFKELVNQMGKGISAGWSFLTTAIAGIPAFLTGIGQTFWSAGSTLGSKIISGIKSGISGAASLASTFATTVKNKIKSAVNTGVIDKVNRALEFNISAFGQTVSINPPDIPRLAKGGVVSTPTMAMVGDSPGESEIVAPESKLHQVMSDVMRGSGGGGQTVNLTVNNADASAEDIVRELTFAYRTKRF